MKIRSLLLILLCVLLSGLAVAQGESDALLEQLRVNSLDTHAISSKFTQEKHLSVFNDVIVSEGAFLFQRPRRLRWEYISPFRSGFVLNGESGKRWDDLTGNHDVDLSSDPAMRVVAEQVLAWATFDLETLTRQYDISVLGTKPVTLRLVPKSSALKSVVSHLRIEFSPNAKSVSVVELHDVDGDYTRLSFYETLLNPSIPEGVF
nr:outer membrane lipoprotein carrier protein LolA [Pseudodesulfovibrio sp.]